MEWFDYWTKERMSWFVRYGVKSEHLKFRVHEKDSLAHYAKCCSDIEFLFPMGWSELEGIANRGDYDLKQHSLFSGKSLQYYDEESKEAIVPYVIEPSAGVDRAILAFLCDAYAEEPDKDEIRTVLHLHPAIAPIKVAVLPLSKKEPLANLAKEVYAAVRQRWSAVYDDAQSIGRRYRRQDEIGTPLCVTIDFQSLEDKQVTVRDRDSMLQVRVPIADLKAVLAEKLGI
jgi:glycyl-tRNA synthetase